MTFPMPFGKYRGVALDRVPASYLRWVLDNLHDLDPELRREIDEALGRRHALEVLRREAEGRQRRDLAAARELAERTGDPLARQHFRLLNLLATGRAQGRIDFGLVWDEIGRLVEEARRSQAGAAIAKLLPKREQDPTDAEGN
jgi:hypothetical protein